MFHPQKSGFLSTKWNFCSIYTAKKKLNRILYWISFLDHSFCTSPFFSPFHRPKLYCVKCNLKACCCRWFDKIELFCAKWNSIKSQFCCAAFDTDDIFQSVFSCGATIYFFPFHSTRERKRKKPEKYVCLIITVVLVVVFIASW